MQIRVTLTVLFALAIAIAFSPTQDLQAASMFGPGSQIGTESMTHMAQDKAKAKAKPKAKAKAKAKGKRTASKGPGRCGTGNYWSKGSCLAAANKK